MSYIGFTTAFSSNYKRNTKTGAIMLKKQVRDYAATAGIEAYTILANDSEFIAHVHIRKRPGSCLVNIFQSDSAAGESAHAASHLGIGPGVVHAVRRPVDFVYQEKLAHGYGLDLLPNALSGLYVASHRLAGQAEVKLLPSPQGALFSDGITGNRMPAGYRGSGWRVDQPQSGYECAYQVAGLEYLLFKGFYVWKVL